VLCVFLTSNYPTPIGLLAALLLLTALTAPAAQAQKIFYVTTTGTAAPTSASTLQASPSWATSTTDLQGAINAATTGDQIWVAAGTYKPTSNTADRGASFAMLPGVKIYGGFVGSETALSQRPAINPQTGSSVSGSPSSSTLSGDIDNDGTLANNSYHVINNPASLSLNNSAILDGFVITGGNANGSSDPDNRGGGVYNNGGGSGQVCSPSFRNCLLQGNSASLRGGAMNNDGRNSGLSSPVLINCAFVGNSATTNGGAMFNDGQNGQSSPVLTNCTLQNNSVSSTGGAMFNFGLGGQSSPVLTNCALQSNSANSGGAMYNSGVNGQSRPVLTNCAFVGNWATFGGAMYNDGRNGGVSSPVLTNSVLWKNADGNAFFNLNATGASATYSLFDNTTNVDISGPGNLTTTTSPFASTASVALAVCSPAINAGDPNSQTAATGPYSVTALPQTDLVGQPRIVSPGLPVARVDMGAVEYQAPQYPTRLYVAASQTATNGGDGLTWKTAFKTIESALAYPCSQSLTEVWIAQGLYKPASPLQMKNGVTIYGGFVGSETVLTARPAINPVNGNPSSTTISGDNTRRVFEHPSSLSLTISAALDGVIITEGRSNQGGGMYNEGSPGTPAGPTLRNCSFLNNQATGGTLNNGGAMYNERSGPTLTNCSFQGNQATGGSNQNNGGAMANSNSNPTLTNCSFTGNQATGGNLAAAGAMINNSSNPTLTNCSFLNNQASGGTNNAGGAMFNQVGTPILTNCSFQGNQATQGGAMYNNSSTPTLTNCILWNNAAGVPGGNNSIAFNPITARYCLFDAGVTGYTSHPSNLTTTTSPFASTVSVALAVCSPAINAGDPTSQTAVTAPYSVTALPQTDLAGQPRIVGQYVDMGAVEFQGVGGPVSSFTLTLAGSATATCAASPTITLSGSQTGVSYQLLRDGDNAGSPLTGTGNALNFGPQSASGIYSVLATNISSSCSAVMEGAVTVVSDAALPTVSLAPAPSTTLTCSQTSVTLTATASVTALRWSHGPTNTSALTVNQPGSYWVTATAPNGCSVVSNTVVVSQNVGLVATLTASNTGLCAGGSALLTATVGAGLPGVDYRFSGPGGLAQNGPTNTLSATQTGAYSVTVTGANGCTATQQVSLTVSAGPVAQLTYLNGGRTVQVTGGSSYQLVQPMVTINGVYQLRETFESTNGFFELKRPGPFWVIVTSQNGCSTRVDGSAP
jgi:hypothetical protein